MVILSLPNFFLWAIFCLIIAFGGASPAAAQPEAAAPAADSQDTEVEGESDPEDGSDDEAAIEAEEGDEERAAIARSQRDDVEDLYVTATKREEALQDVPISMSAMNSEFLDDSGITQFGQLSEYVPNLKINPVTDTRGTIMRIRGIGSVGSNAGIDPSVGVFIDGIYQGRAGMSVGDLLDIERVEVLRGPQGTLYGKNTAAGLINIISKRPSYDWETVTEFVYGNYSNYEGRASVNIPIVDERVAGRFSGYWVGRDGFDKRLNVAGREFGLQEDLDPPYSVPPDPPFSGSAQPLPYNPAPDEPFTPTGPGADDRFLFVDERVNDADKWGAKGRLLFDVMDSLSFLVTGDYSHENTKCCVADIITFDGFATLSSDSLPDDPTDPGGSQSRQGLLTFDNLAKYWVTRADGPMPGPPPGPNPRPPYQGTGIPLPHDDAFDRVVAANVDPKNKVGIGGVSLDATWEVPEIPVLGGSSVNLIGSWRTYSNDSSFDGDFSYYEVARWSTDVDLDQYSAELRLTSPGGELVDYQTGFYFYHQDMHTEDELSFFWDAIHLIPFFPNPTRNNGDNTHKTWSYAGFGQLTVNPIDQVSLTGGLRVTHEKKTRVGSQTCERWVEVDGEWQWVVEDRLAFDTPPVCGLSVTVRPGENERSVTNVSGMANLRYFPTEDVMLYASFATGFKSGGFNQLRVLLNTPTEFDDEESMNFEVGFKTAWFEQMITFNLTGFYTEYDEFQAQLFDGTSVNVRNAGSLESYGVEGDLVLAPAPGLVIGTSLGFNIAEYTDFENGEQTAAQRWDATNGFLLDGCTAPDAPPDLCVQDLTGKRLDNAPRWSVNSFVQYEYLLPWLPVQLFMRAEYAYESMRFLAPDLDPALKQKPTHIVNLRAGFRAEDQLWEVTGWVRNLSDEEYNVVGFDVPTINGFAGVNGPPRQYGLTVRMSF